MKKTIITLIILIILASLLAIPVAKQKHAARTPDAGITVSYQCAAGKSITATFINGDTVPPADPDLPPTPGGSAHIVLSDGRVLDLKQTISADGARYAVSDESFVFWSKGNGAIVLENNQEKSYIGCMTVAAATAALPRAYVNSATGFSLRLPEGYKIDESYQYQLNPVVTIPGVKFTIPASLAGGTNLSTDTYLSVETLADASSCTADRFLDGINPASDQTDGDMTYSVASASNAGAGNRYEETVYAFPGTSPCVAVRYFIHYTNIQNYDPGTRSEFDRAALLNTFDMIRRSITLN